MSGTPLIRYIINTGTWTVHDGVHGRYMDGTWLGTSLKILKYNNTLTLKYWILLKIKNFELALLFLGLKFKNLKPSRGIKLCCPRSPWERFFLSIVNNSFKTT